MVHSNGTSVTEAGMSLRTVSIISTIGAPYPAVPQPPGILPTLTHGTPLVNDISGCVSSGSISKTLRTEASVQVLSFGAQVDGGRNVSPCSSEPTATRILSPGLIAYFELFACVTPLSAHACGPSFGAVPPTWMPWRSMV